MRRFLWLVLLAALPVHAQIGPPAAPGSFAAGGDLSGTSTSQHVEGLKQVPFCAGYTPTAGQTLVYSTTNSPNPCYIGSASIGLYSLFWTSTDAVNNAFASFGSGSGGDGTCPTPAGGTSYLCTKAGGIAASIDGGGYAALAGTKVYTVATLPAASSLPAGTQLTVSDASTFTVGTCTGSGSDYMIAITSGSVWTCH